MAFFWDKSDLIISRNTVDLDWLKLNVMCPVPIIRNDDTIRIYAAFCDKENRGRVGYIDVEKRNPSNVIDISCYPVLDIGSSGTFDENGVLPTCIFMENNKMYMYYCGFQKQINVPYTSLLGLAVSEDDGNSFRRVRKTPVLERIDDELFIRTGAYCVKNDEKYEIYYASGNKWFELYLGKYEPIYDLRVICTESKDTILGQGKTIIHLEGDEYGITIPQFIKQDNTETLVFSVRSKSHGYQIEYANKENGKWKRKGEIGLRRTAKEWYSEMQCFGKLIELDDRILLFFSGNHYGIGGLGWAKMPK